MINITEFTDGIPLWGVFLASVTIILLSSEFGFQLGKRQRRHSTVDGKIQTGPVVSASLGLLAFILAFSFGSVTSRLDERKQLILDEANTIGTTYLRAELLPQAGRIEIQRILYDYVTLRIDIIKGSVTNDNDCVLSPTPLILL